jgi:signal transduction histidine kinase
MQDTDLQELQKDTFVIVILLLSVANLILFYIMLVKSALFNEPNPVWWLPSLLIVLSCILSYKFYRKDQFRRATYFLVDGLTLSVLSFILWPNSQFPYLQAYLLVLVVALAGMLINPQAAGRTAAVGVIATIIVVLFLKHFVYYPIAWRTLSLWGPLLMTCAMAAVSWISSDHLTTTLKWAYDSQERAQQRSRELFEKQQEVQRAYILLESANIRLKEAEVAAVQANQLKTRFITSLSHELRTPLSAIINFSFILSKNRHGQVTAEQQDYLNRIHHAGDLLLEIVNDLLDLAKIEAEQMELFREAIDLAEVGESVMGTISGLVGDKPIQLHQEIAPQLPLVCGDQTRVRQILINLLGNAVKYTERGHITLQIIQQDDRFLKVSVTDTGIGIKREDFQRIFEEFQQTEDAFALRKVGTGLGLPISKKFVELHGGQLWVESEYGAGTTFYFTLPILRDQEGRARPLTQPDALVEVV